MMSARDQMIASIATVIGVFAFAWGVYRLLRGWRRLGSLMDDGDGQGGVPPLPRRTDTPGLVHPAFEQWLATRPPVRRDPLDGIVVNAEFERIAAQLHYDSVREMLDDEDDAG